MGAFASFLSDMKTAPVVLVQHKHSKRQATFIKWTGIYINMPYEFIYILMQHHGSKYEQNWDEQDGRCIFFYSALRHEFFFLLVGWSFLQFCPSSCTQQNINETHFETTTSDLALERRVNSSLKMTRLSNLTRIPSHTERRIISAEAKWHWSAKGWHNKYMDWNNCLPMFRTKCLYDIISF